MTMAKYEKYCDWIEDNMCMVDADEIMGLFHEYGKNNIKKVINRITSKYDRSTISDLWFAWDYNGTFELDDLVQTRDDEFPAYTLRQTQTALRIHPPSYYKCCEGCDDEWCRCCAGVCKH